ncbi:MAG: hypothetical protein CL760_11205 [Chloroflexi bacterium]|nr:hypothetical protein [Chloroflexota bacterium]
MAEKNEEGININVRVVFEEVAEDEVLWKIYEKNEAGEEVIFSKGEAESMFEAKVEVNNELMSFL